MKKIVIINQDGGNLIIDIDNTLANNNPNIILVAGRLAVRNKPLAEFVKVRRIIKYQRNNKSLRLLSWIIASFQILFIVRTKYRNVYLFLSPTRSLTLSCLFFAGTGFL